MSTDNVDPLGTLPDSYLLSDLEASAVRKWAKAYRLPPTHPYASRSKVRTDGIRGVATSIGLADGDAGRVHLSRCLSPDAEKRRAIGHDSFVSLLRLLMRDRRATYNVRRVASDEVQRAMDRAIQGEAFAAVTGSQSPRQRGYMVAVIPV